MLRFVLIATIIATLAPRSLAQTPRYQGALTLSPIASNTKCLASQNGNVNGSPVVIADCVGGADQLFTFQNGQVTMYGGTMCLDVTDGVNADGTKLQIWQCYPGAPNQSWYYNFWEKSLSWTNRGKCLDLTDWSLANGNRVQIWSCASGHPNQVWNTGYLFPNLPNTSQIGQTGTNACGTGSSASSQCQTIWLNSYDDFCLFGPPTAAPIGNIERTAIAYCTRGTHGTRVFPPGTFTGVHWVKTPDYVQITGQGDFTKILVPAGDDGGELDNRGADGNGNPIGGLVYGNVFGPNQQFHDWTEFLSDDEFCIRACTGPNGPINCNHIYDVMGCWWNMPANYDAGVFESCSGDNAIPMGLYGTSRWYQGVSPTPPPHPAPSSSNCVTTSTI